MSTAGYMDQNMAALAPAEKKNPPAAKPDPAPPAAPVEPIAAPAELQMPKGSVSLKNQFQVLTGSKLPQFDSPCATAYEAKEFTETSRKCAAFICTPGLPVRHNVMRAISGVTMQGVMSVFDHGPIDWPDGGDARLAAIMSRPRGERYAAADAATFPKMAEQDILRLVVQPAVAALREFKNKGVTFRGFRVDNLYWEDSNKQSLIFGESYTCPPAYRQPAVYEQIVSAMCDPAARGEGGVGEDIFSLGVTLLFLAIGRNPLLQMEEDALIYRRMEEGSFPVYTGQFPIPQTILEAVRGMVADDPEDRWSLEDLEAWARGSRQAVRQPRSQRHASRPFTFTGRDFMLVPSMTYALARHWTEAGEAIRNKSLDAWLRRSLADEKLADTVMLTINPSGKSSFNISDDLLVARTCIALDKNGPIRFRNFTGRIEGLGSALAMAQGDNEKIGTITQIISSKLPITWLNLQQKNYENYHKLEAKFETLPSVLENGKQPGFGFERCLYELNAELPCMSPSLKGFYVATPQELLPALEKISKKPDRPRLPIDRHIAAFLGARMLEIKDSDLRSLGPPADTGTQVLSMMMLLSKLQRVFRVRELSGLTYWCVDVMKVVVDKYKNIARRKRIGDAVASAARSGQLQDLLQQANNEKEWATDEVYFQKAAIEHAAITFRIAALEEIKRKQEQLARAKGESVAVFFAGILAIGFLAAVFYMQLTGV